MNEEIVPEADRTIALKREVLDHARDLFSHYGYSKTNIGDIAARAGMSPGNLYRYFKNKQAIGEEVVREHMADVELRMAAALPDGSASAEQAIRTFVESGLSDMVVLVQSDPKVVELATMICASDSGILARHIEWKVVQIEQLFAAGVREGSLTIDDTRQAAEVLMDATIAFWNPITLAEMEHARVPLRLRRVLDFIFLGLRTR